MVWKIDAGNWCAAGTAAFVLAAIMPLRAFAAHDLSISGSGNSNLGGNGSMTTPFFPNADTANLSVVTLDAALNFGGGVYINTNTAGSQPGDIKINASVLKSTLGKGPATLILNAAGGIYSSHTSGIGISSTADNLNLNFTVGGDISMNFPVTTLGGSVSLSAGGGNVSLSSTINTGGGLVSVTATTITLSGTLDAGGTLTGSVTNTGTISPGAAPGLLSVTGDLDLNGGSIVALRIGGTGQGTTYDFLHASNGITLGGNLDLDFANGFESSVMPDEVFTIATGDDGVSGAFANVASGARLGTDDGAGSFVVTYDDGKDVTLSDFQGVPEPSCLSMVALTAWRFLGRNRKLKRDGLDKNLNRTALAQAFQSIFFG